MWEFFDNFHFLRPFWLGAIVPALLLLWCLWRQSQRATTWRDIIAPTLIKHLLTGELTRGQKYPLAAVLLAWVLACCAIAGPTWEKLAQPVHKTESALVILLDLSPSMLAEDLKPSRLIRARLKLTDLLSRRREGVTALVAYAGEAHVVTPLTDDTATIISLLPALHPGVMPLRGSNTEMAVEQALELLRNGGSNRGQILLVTDGVAPEAEKSIKNRLRNQLRNQTIELSILAVGSTEGAPILAANGGFVKDDSGAIVVAKVDIYQLQQMAHSLGGIFTPLRTDESDIDILSQPPSALEKQTRQLEREFDSWNEVGSYLVLAILPLLLLAFRRGWLLAPFIALPLLPVQDLHASTWDDLWTNPDRQGQALFQQGDPGKAAELFKDHRWRGSAHYRNGDYDAAANAFAQGEQALDHYNRGNALAQAGRLDDAIDAYKQALAKDPTAVDAKTNLDIVEQLKRQQQQQEQQSSDDKQNPQQKDNNQQNSSANKNGKQDQDQQRSGEEKGSQSTGNSAEREDSDDNKSSRDPSRKEEEKQQQEQATQAEPKNSAQQAQQQTQQQNADPGDTDADTKVNNEQQQALEQWLRQVPDDPSGLLRNKFQYQYQQRRQEYRAGKWQPPANKADKRW